jgi:outer membrane protein OmpA-like peptidoglycan-associated protein
LKKAKFTISKLSGKITCLVLFLLLSYSCFSGVSDKVYHHVPEAEIWLQIIQNDSVSNKKTSEKNKEKPSLPIIYFHWERYDIDSSFYPLLNSVAAIMNVNESMNLQINGYTDNIGEETYNSNLSTLRASAVAKYLLAQGISNSRVIYKGMGAAHFVAPNDGHHNHMNRRVELLFVK